MGVKKEYFYRYTGTLFHVKIKPFFQDFHKLTMEGDYEYPLHVHNNYELIIVNESIYYCLLNNVELTVYPGEFLIIKPGDTHQDHLYDGQFHYVLHFLLNSEISGKQSNVRIFADNIQPVRQVGKCATEISLLFLKQLENELNMADSYSGCIQDAIFESFFWKILRSLSQDIISEYLIGFVQDKEYQLRLYRIFEKYCNSNISVTEVAKQMGMSKRSLTYFCQKAMGISPAKAFTSYKFDKAAELLAGTRLPIKDISNKFGFDNPFHFSRVFKRLFGYSPKIHRNKVLKNCVP